MEQADNVGDTKAVYEGVAALSGKSRKRFSKQPTRKKVQHQAQSKQCGTRSLDGPDELGEIWQRYLAGKFSATTLEAARRTFEDLGENELSDEDQLTIQEYLDAVKHMKNNKAVGPDGVPAEVYKSFTAFYSKSGDTSASRET